MDEVLTRLRSFRLLNKAQSGVGVSKNYSDTCNACSFDAEQNVAVIHDTLKKNLDGLCLDCIRQGAEQGTGKDCRIEHRP